MMSIYRNKLEDKVQAKKTDKESASVMKDDDEISEEDSDDMGLHLVKAGRNMMFHRRRTSILTWFIVALVIFVVLFLIGTIFWYQSSNDKSAKPYVGLVRMHYHTWKDSAAGVKRGFKVEGEFYQQVEIDIENGHYEKLNVPSIMNMLRTEIVHDFHKKLTAIISLDRLHCFILPLNFTFVKPLQEFYEIVQNIQAGHDSTNAEIVSSDYMLLSTPVRDVSQFGPHIYKYCQHLETLRLAHDTEPNAPNKNKCWLHGQYCLGNAGTDYMGVVHITRCS